MSTDPRIQQVLQSIREGNKANAQQIVSALIRENPNNANLWYLAAGAATDKDKQIELLQRALKLNPQHAKAREMISRLDATDDEPVVKRRPPDRLLIGVIAITVLAVAAIIIYAGLLSNPSGGLGSLVRQFIPCKFSEEQASAIEKFLDSTDIARSTARMSLSSVVLDLQQQYRSYQRLSSSDCLKEINQHIESGMSYTVDGLASFLADSDSVLSTVDTDLAIKEYDAAYALMQKSSVASPDFRLLDAKLMVFKITS